VSAVPLSGRTFLLPAEARRAEAFAARLRTLGARVFEVALLRIEPPEDIAPLDAALRTAKPYDWLAFTSARGVEAVALRLTVLGLKPGAVAQRVAAVGPATARAAKEAGFSVDAVPAEYVSDGLADAIGKVEGKRILLPRGQLGRKELARTLRERGAAVDEVVAYRTVRANARGETAPLDVVDTVVFTSASAVHFLAETVGAPAARELCLRASAACIGPVTGKAAREAGFVRVLVAPEHTVEGLISALVEEAPPDA
jgi:uroporphyrinogen-III synthase